MDTGFFFKVWHVYRAHWGMDEQQILSRKHTANLLKNRLLTSSKMRCLRYMHHILDVMWGMNLFTRPDEVVDSVRDMAAACLSEEGDEPTHRSAEPAVRMLQNIHKAPTTECQEVYMRHWEVLRRPILPHVINNEESVYRVSALVALF